jgi:ketosteroid isomerase-like protein
VEAMTNDQSKAADEAQIRQIIDRWRMAISAKDLDAAMSHYASDILSYDLVPPLRYEGADAQKENLEEWFPTFTGPIGLDIRDLRITVGGGAAFATSLNRITGARTNGEQTDVWVRATICFVKSNGDWIVAHEHVSVPFYMDGSYRAAIDLKP